MKNIGHHALLRENKHLGARANLTLERNAIIEVYFILY